MARLPLRWSSVEPHHIYHELYQFAHGLHESTTIKEDTYGLDSRIMSYIVNILICISMILLDSLLQYFLFIVGTLVLWLNLLMHRGQHLSPACTSRDVNRGSHCGWLPWVYFAYPMASPRANSLLDTFMTHEYILTNVVYSHAWLFFHLLIQFSYQVSSDYGYKIH
jgi:hypothetical protein